MELYENICIAEKKPNIIKYNDTLYLMAFKLMKLLPALYMIERAEKDGRLNNGGTVIETSSGTFALGLAMVCALKKYPLIIIGDPAIDPGLQRRLTALGAEVILVRKPAASGGFQQSRLDKVHKLLNTIPGSFWPCQYHNPDNAAAYGEIAEEAFELTGNPDFVVGPVGSGGSLCGISRVWKYRSPQLATVAVDTNGSMLFGQKDTPRLLRGLGNSIIPKNLDYRLINEVHWVTPESAFYATRLLHSQSGIFMGPTSGAAFLVANFIARQNPGKKVVAILPDEGTRYLNTIYNDNWLSRNNIKRDMGCLEKRPRLIQNPEEAGSDWSYCGWNGRRIRCE